MIKRRTARSQFTGNMEDATISPALYSEYEFQTEQYQNDEGHTKTRKVPRLIADGIADIDLCAMFDWGYDEYGRPAPMPLINHIDGEPVKRKKITLHGFNRMLKQYRKYDPERDRLEELRIAKEKEQRIRDLCDKFDGVPDHILQSKPTDAQIPLIIDAEPDLINFIVAMMPQSVKDEDWSKDETVELDSDGPISRHLK